MASEPNIANQPDLIHRAEVIDTENDKPLDVFEHLFNGFLKTNRHFVANLDLKSIDGVDLFANVDVAETRSCGRESTQCVRFTFSCDWKHKLLYTQYCESPSQLKLFITETLPTLKYNEYANQLISTEPTHELAQQLMKHLPKNENVVSLYDECCVCLESVKTKTSCEHPLCYKCESKLKNKKCPLCRASYEHSQQDCDEEYE